LRQKGGDRFKARSAGLNPLTDVHPLALGLLTSAGISTDGLHCKGWGEFLAAANLVKIDVIVTLSEDARLEIPNNWPGNPVRAHWPIDDPLATSSADVREWKFRKCFSTLETRINTLVKSKIAQSSCELLLQLKDIGMVV
jgi:protein-tyrosine-phosphatase